MKTKAILFILLLLTSVSCIHFCNKVGSLAERINFGNKNCTNHK